MTTMSVHVLDTVLGQPAAGLDAVVAQATGVEIARTTTADGRIQIGEIAPGQTRLRLETSAWFAARGRPTFYPFVEIIFVAAADEHHHIAVLLSPFAYSTYRGS